MTITGCRAHRFWGQPLAIAMGLGLLAASACGGPLSEMAAGADTQAAGPALDTPATGDLGGEGQSITSKGEATPAAAVAGAGAKKSSASGAVGVASRPDDPEANGLPAVASGVPGEIGPTGQTPDLGPAPGIEPDPNYQDTLAVSGLDVGGWNTDFSLHSAPFHEILSGGVPRDGIPPLDAPSFVTSDEADPWLGDQEPVVSFELNGEARAYPLQILTWHEIVNDLVGGVPVAVTFCPLCNSAIVFDRRLEGVVLDFGTSGRLRHSDLIMWDRQTESWWQQLTGEAIIGRLTGRRLEFLPAAIVSWQDFKAAHPNGVALSRETGFSRAYGRNPYAGYDEAANPPFLFFGDLDGRLLPKERVVAVTIDGVDLAFPFSALEAEGVINHSTAALDIAVFFKKGTTSALDKSSIRDSRDVGAAAVYDANLNGRKLTFAPDDAAGTGAAGGGFIDRETGSAWNILGQATGGELAGVRLTPVVHANHFWFAWAAFKPDAEIVRGSGE